MIHDGNCNAFIIRYALLVKKLNFKLIISIVRWQINLTRILLFPTISSILTVLYALQFSSVSFAFSIFLNSFHFHSHSLI